MSLKGQALKDVVLERLVVAADEIFGIFERTLVEYKAEILGSKLLQRPHVVLYRQDIPTLAASVDSGSQEDSITTNTIRFPFVKTTENTLESSAEEDPANENTPDSLISQCDGEEPGGSNKKHPDKCLVTDISSYSGLTDIRLNKYDGKSLSLSHRKNSVAKNDQRHRSFPKKRLQFVYRCQVCGMKFAQNRYLIAHVRRIHEQVKHHTCLVCHKGFFQKGEFLIHMRGHTGERPFSCSNCERSFMSRKALKRHKCSQRQSPDRPHRNLSPWEGSVSSTSERELSDVQAVIVGADCGPETTNIKQEEDSPVKITLPSVRDEENVNKSTNHKAEEPRAESFPQCEGARPGCSVELHLDNGKQPNSSRDLKEKTSPKHDDRNNSVSNNQRHTPFLRKRLQLGTNNKCPICGKKLLSQGLLSRHIRQVHDEEKLHTCSVCEKGFYRKYDHDIHMRVHTGERPFRCSGCGKCYTSNGTLKSHKCSQTRTVAHPHPNHSLWEGSVPCSSETELLNIQAVVVNTDSGPESNCVKLEEDSSLRKNSEAEKVATNDQGTTTLKKHIRGKNRCSVCGKKFSEQKSLVRHIREFHNEEKLFTCSFCHKGFFRKERYEVHMRLHTGERPFSCSVCSKSYKCKSSLTNHKCSDQEHSPWEGSVPCTSERALYDSGPVPTQVKQEEDSDVEISLPSAQTEGNLKLSAPVFSPAEERRPESILEEPGCSIDVLLDANDQHSCSDDDNFTDSEPRDRISIENNRQDVKTGQSERLKAGNVMGNEQLHGCARVQCFKSLKNQNQQKTTAQGPPFACHICHKAYNRRKSYIAHMKMHSNRLRCLICQRAFAFPSQLKEHMLNHTDEKPFACSICGRKFRRNYYLVRHFHSTHKREKPHTCPVCQKGFYRKYEYGVHMRTHMGEQPFGCSVCGKAFRAKDSLRAHKCPQRQSLEQNNLTAEREMFDIQAVTVGAAGHAHSSQEVSTPSLKSLLKSPHQEEQRIPAFSREQWEGEEPENDQLSSCSDTDNSSDWEFMDKSSSGYNEEGLSQDSVMHDASSGDQAFRCGQCFKTFESERKLKKHLNHHAGEGSFTCQVCNKTYSHKTAYKQHLKIHSKNPLRCPICQRVFNRRYALKLHMTIHTGEKPFSCSLCGMKFRLQSTRKKHFYNVHTLQKPYTCPVCQKGFVEMYSYKIHMRIHTGERPFRCSVCARGFTERNQLKKHMKKNHQGQAEVGKEVG